ncbi:iron chelate uptake ABC transporter family permease subunit [Nocardioides alcanivorans]|uniref:iron chelate uptake ABC transporter family permease subunit n=1 Tax=Nocardioides alcanivorans TaxID=2897352 RepID=UPI00289F30A5|nr:iron chelate uptake ABC transporter family permease subunit [Nocardioides alcanivorans]
MSTARLAVRRRGLALGPFAVRVRWRALLAGLGTTVVLVALLAVSVFTGTLHFEPDRVLAAIAGNGNRVEQLVIVDHRLARALAAVLVGFALGCAGALTQSITRNPIASPDILGVISGASLCAVAVATQPSLRKLFGNLPTGEAISLAAMLGGLLTTALILALSWRAGFDGLRLILVGLSVNAIAIAGVSFALTRTEDYSAQLAMRWLTGSLAPARMSDVERLLPLVLAGAAVCVVLHQGLARLRMGRDLTQLLGGRPARIEAVALLVAVLLVAGACAVAGPVAFVAFVAAQGAMRLFGTAGPRPWPPGCSVPRSSSAPTCWCSASPASCPWVCPLVCWARSSCSTCCCEPRGGPVSDTLLTTETPLRLQRVTAGYGSARILHDLDIEIPAGRFTSIIGPNGCGKSTTLRVMARLLVPTSGDVLCRDRPIADLRPKDLATELAMLPQVPVAPRA